MLNLIASDFYKLFKRKSFYVCALIAMVMSCLGVILLNSVLNIGGIEITAQKWDITVYMPLLQVLEKPL